VQVRCSQRTMDANSLFDEIDRIDNARVRHWGISKKDFKGARFHVAYMFGQVPAAYRGNPEGTTATIEATASGYKLVHVQRDYASGSRLVTFPMLPGMGIGANHTQGSLYNANYSRIH